MTPTSTILTSALTLSAASAAIAQADLFSNRGPNASTPALATGATTASGVPAPAGAQWSEVQRPAAGNAGAVAGFSSHLIDGGGGGAYRFADDFTVPAGGWTLTSVVLYAYQSGFDGPPAPFESLNVRIWSGRPGDKGSEIVFGDDATNRLATAVPTDIYRVFSTNATPEPAPADTTRRIWAGEASLTDALGVGVFLPAGTYWLDWQHVSTQPGQEIFSPPATLVGQRGAAGANARQLAPGGAWRDAVDPGKPAPAADVAQDMPFLIRGLVGPACPADWTGDGVTNSTDVSEFVNDWFLDQVQGTLVTDFNHDGVSNSTDVSEFINAWFVDQASGCGG